MSNLALENRITSLFWKKYSIGLHSKKNVQTKSPNKHHPKMFNTVLTSTNHTDNQLLRTAQGFCLPSMFFVFQGKSGVLHLLKVAFLGQTKFTNCIRHFASPHFRQNAWLYYGENKNFMEHIYHVKFVSAEIRQRRYLLLKHSSLLR